MTIFRHRGRQLESDEKGWAICPCARNVQDRAVLMECSRVYRFNPWKSPYIRWRFENVPRKEAANLTAAKFFQLAWKYRDTWNARRLARKAAASSASPRLNLIASLLPNCFAWRFFGVKCSLPRIYARQRSDLRFGVSKCPVPLWSFMDRNTNRSFPPRSG